MLQTIITNYDITNTHMHTQIIFIFNRWLCIQSRFIYYTFVYKRYFDFIPTIFLTFHIFTIDTRYLFPKGLNVTLSINL